MSPLVAFLGVGVLAGSLYLLQRLRVRHREVVVPTTLFWQAALQETRARVLVRRFRHPLAYALILLIASLIWIAVGAPAAGGDDDGRVTVFLLDGSAGMSWGDRFARAKRTLLEQVARAPGGCAEVYFCGGWPRTLLRADEDPLLLERRLEGMAPEATPGSLERAIGLLPLDRSTRIVVVGDALFDADSLPEGWELLRPGRNDARPSNGGVVALGVSEAASGAWDRVDVWIEAPTGYTTNLETLVDVPADGREVVVRCSGSDAIAFDNEARFVLPRRSVLRVQPTPELRDVLALDPGVTFAEDGIEIELVEGANVVLEGPRESLADAPGGLLEFVDRSRDADPVHVEWRVGARRRVFVGRDLLRPDSNFTRTRAYPLFVARAVRWLAASAEFPAYVAAGERIPGSELSPPVAGAFRDLHASLLNPLKRSDTVRDEGLNAAGGSSDIAGWLVFLALLLLGCEWYLFQTGRLP